MLGLLLNILNANEKYLVPHRDTLTIPIQTQLSERQKKFSVFFFLQFSILVWILKVLKKKMTLIDFLFSKLRTLQTESDKCLKSPVSENASTSNMVNVPKHCSHLHHIAFSIFIDNCQVNWVGKSASFWHEKFWDCLLTHWLPMKCILFFIETI